MRKLIGLLFLTATLTATSAYAQAIYIDRGDPNAVIVSAGGRYMADTSFGGSLLGAWTYRGVFDVGADLTYLKYNGGDLKKLASISLTPFLTWHLMRGEEEELPMSIALSLGVTREFFTGNAPVANPEGWGLFLGPSLYRKIEIGTNKVFIPEVLAAYDLKVTRRYSSAWDETMGVRDQTSGYSSTMKHSGRLLVKLNFLFKTGGKAKYTATPYVGYQSGLIAGAYLGALF